MSFYCSGCATIVGAVIGHQSGEMLAGAAIGAAVDFGDDIAVALGQTFGDEHKQLQEKATLDSEKGCIGLPRSAFSVNKLEKLIILLQKKLEQNSWAYTVTKKKVSKGRILLSETWNCQTADNIIFDLMISYKKNHDPTLKITPTQEHTGKKGEITIQIYQWLKDISAAES